MKYYMAPLEGISGYIYRSTYEKHFGQVDKYFTPFISPGQKRICRTRELNDILPEHNTGMRVVPQILTNNSEMFIKTVDYLKEFGYDEFNLNLGCPMGTVVSKKKGAGFLSEPDKLKCFLDEIFAADHGVKISVKTRIGLESAEEFSKLMEIYNAVPLCELIVHPRTREDYYKNKPHMQAFSLAYDKSLCKVCYNGDIFTKENMDDLTQKYPKIDTVMLGRGILRYPGLVDYLKNNRIMTKDNLLAFHNDLYSRYKENLYGDKTVLFKCKEIWNYMIHSFEPCPKLEKKIKKVQRLYEYESVIEELFSQKKLIL